MKTSMTVGLAGTFASLASSPLHAAGGEETLVISADGKASGTMNGAPVSLQINASGISLPVMNPEIAQRLDLRHSIFAVQAKVGAQKVPGKTGVVKMVVAGAPQKRRILWFQRAQRAGYDGVLGPEAVPQSTVAFQLGARPSDTPAAAKVYLLPLARQNNRVGTYVAVGGSQIFVQWDFTRRRTLATAAAASTMAAALGGSLGGKRERQEIEFGIERPVQALHLERALAVGPLRLTDLDARVADYGTTDGIRREDGDPNEIIVTAKTKKDRNVYALTIGSEDVRNCTRIEFDKRISTIRLFCS